MRLYSFQWIFELTASPKINYKMFKPIVNYRLIGLFDFNVLKIDV